MGPRADSDSEQQKQQEAVRDALARALVALADGLEVSSVHVTFGSPEDAAALARAGFLERHGFQCMFENAGYADFDAFLAVLKQVRALSLTMVGPPISPRSLHLLVEGGVI